VAHGVEPLDLELLDLAVDVERLGLRLVVALEELVDPDDDVAAVVELPLEVVGRLRDLALEPVVLDAVDRTLEHRSVAERVEVGEQLLGLPLHLVGERLDEVRAAERVGHVGP
jgi:hypothetical protein